MLLLPLLLACAAPTDRPNLVLVIGDDQGWMDFGFMGSPNVQTPNLDRLAAGGTVFTHGINTASLCRPSLRTLLTGLHPHQLRDRTESLHGPGAAWRGPIQMRDFVTLPRLLGEQGYASFEGGKFWEADHRIAGFTHGMQKPGDDPSYGGVGRWIGREPMTPLYEFIEEHRDEPFFVWFAPQLPHIPHDPPPRYRAPYAGRGLSPTALQYYANATRLDDVVGQLIAFLEREGLRERTLVVFLSDNGWDQPPDVNRPVMLGDGPRGKGTLYELGFRTPIVFSWPGVIPEGERRGELVSTVDLFPTLLGYAGASVPANRPGYSLRPLLESRGTWPRNAVAGKVRDFRAPTDPRERPRRLPLNRAAYFLRTPQWRYVWYPYIDVEELYEIDADPYESRNVAASHPELVTRLREQTLRWERETERPFASPLPADDPGGGS